MKACAISAVKAHVILTPGMGGNYTSREPGHWIVDERQANPLSVYPDGVNLRATGARETVGGILVEIETDAGIVGIATGAGGYGPVRERTTEMIAEDLREGWITPECARRDYGCESDTSCR